MTPIPLTKLHLLILLSQRPLSLHQQVHYLSLILPSSVTVNFFFRSDTFLIILIFLQAQQDDPVLTTVYKWLKQKQRPHFLTTPIIKANSFLYTYYKRVKTSLLKL